MKEKSVDAFCFFQILLKALTVTYTIIIIYNNIYNNNITIKYTNNLLMINFWLVIYASCQ